MKKIDPPNVTFATAVEEVISGIGAPADRAVHEVAFADPASLEASYVQCAVLAELYAVPRVAAEGDPYVYGALRKSHLTKMYTQYFVPEAKPARRIYELIKVAANGKCPLCGGVGQVRTLDHYLPKANFPLYSILPANLVPCCRDCNSDKLNSFAAEKGGQTLHPYFDNEMYFNEQWIHAEVIQTFPPVVQYSVVPPEHWSEIEKARVVSHFVEYRLADKFSIEAAADLPETIHTRKTTLREFTPAEFSSYLSERSSVTTVPMNNWRRVMFAALADNWWFCSQQF
jgi:hypothetical protein